MFRLKFASVMALLALALTTHIAAQTPTPIPKEGTALVAGTVTIKGEAARGVLVFLSPSTRSESISPMRTKTDEAGRFRFERLRAGHYGISAMAPGYVTPNSSQYGTQSNTVNVSENDKIENLNLALVFGGVITGRITDSHGAPVVGHSPYLERINQQGRPERLFLGSNGNMYSTDDRGIYRLYGVPAGRYLIGIGFAQRPNSITVTSARTFYPRTYHPNVTAESEAKIVEVSEGQETTGVDISVGELKKTYDVSGRVLYAENRQPAVGATIQYGVIGINSNTIGAAGSNGDRTNLQGEFRMQNVLPGKYLAFARPEQGDNSYSESVPFEVSEDDVSGIEIKLQPGSSISGVAVLEGVTDPQLVARLPEISLFLTMTYQDVAPPPATPTSKLDARGSFRFSGLQTGRGRIRALTSPTTRFFSVIRVERDGALQQEIAVNTGEQIANIRVILGYGSGIVRGTLRIVGGVLPEKVELMVAARRIDSGLNVGGVGRVDQRGLFRLENVPPGEYELVLSGVYQGQDLPSEFSDLAKLLGAFKERVTISADTEAQVNLVLDLSRKGEN